mgnify:CR=1 FL=1
MAHQAASLLGSEKIGITFTDKAVTPWGGLTLFSGLARQIGLEQALRKALPFQLTSPNATDPVEIVLALMAGVLVGSRRLAHIERLRWDDGVRKILGLKRFVSDTTLSRFLRRFTAGKVAEVFATEAAFRLVCVTCNLISLLQEKLGQDYQTLGTLRAQLLACGALVGRDGKRTMLRLSLAGPWRERFQRALGVSFSTTETNCAAVETG